MRPRCLGLSMAWPLRTYGRKGIQEFRLRCVIPCGDCKRSRQQLFEVCCGLRVLDAGRHGKPFEKGDAQFRRQALEMAPMKVVVRSEGDVDEPAGLENGARPQFRWALNAIYPHAIHLPAHWLNDRVVPTPKPILQRARGNDNASLDFDSLARVSAWRRRVEACVVVSRRLRCS